MAKIYTVTIKNIADGRDLGRIVASHGVKIKREELFLSFNPPENAQANGFYLDLTREKELKLPFKVKKSFVIFVEFINGDYL
ncbi:MAG: hypothetical protein LBM59_00115 [Ruminococcus sp.]|jgi:hypothetical protein|nr:hypothetical protein [Ruminococcus sp.]